MSRNGLVAPDVSFETKCMHFVYGAALLFDTVVKRVLKPKMSRHDYVHLRELHRDEDGRKTAVMLTKATVVPLDWALCTLGNRGVEEEEY